MQFYREYLLNATHILAPLIQLLEGRNNNKESSRSSTEPKTPFKQTDEVESAFTAAKNALEDATFLKHLIQCVRFNLWCDASDFSVAIFSCNLVMTHGNL